MSELIYRAKEIRVVTRSILGLSRPTFVTHSFRWFGSVPEVIRNEVIHRPSLSLDGAFVEFYHVNFGSLFFNLEDIKRFLVKPVIYTSPVWLPDPAPKDNYYEYYWRYFHEAEAILEGDLSLTYAKAFLKPDPFMFHPLVPKEDREKAEEAVRILKASGIPEMESLPFSRLRQEIGRAHKLALETLRDPAAPLPDWLRNFLNSYHEMVFREFSVMSK